MFPEKVFAEAKSNRHNSASDHKPGLRLRYICFQSISRR